MNSYSEVLECYLISEDSDLIAIESFIYSALESDVSSVKKLKTNLNKLVKAKASGNEVAVKQAKDEVEENVKDVNEEATKEKDAKRKAKLKKFAKIGGIIAGTIATAATVAVIAKKIKDNKSAMNTNTEIKSKDNEIKSRANEIRAESEKIRSEMADKRKEIMKHSSELTQKINRAEAEIEATKSSILADREGFREKWAADRARVEKDLDAARSRNDLVRKVGQITSGQHVELTEEEAKAVRELSQKLNKGVENLAKARLGHNIKNIKES